MHGTLRHEYVEQNLLYFLIILYRKTPSSMLRPKYVRGTSLLVLVISKIPICWTKCYIYIYIYIYIHISHDFQAISRIQALINIYGLAVQILHTSYSKFNLYVFVRHVFLWKGTGIV